MSEKEHNLHAQEFQHIKEDMKRSEINFFSPEDIPLNYERVERDIPCAEIDKDSENYQETEQLFDEMYGGRDNWGVSPVKKQNGGYFNYTVDIYAREIDDIKPDTSPLVDYDKVDHTEPKIRFRIKGNRVTSNGSPIGVVEIINEDENA